MYNLRKRVKRRRVKTDRKVEQQQPLNPLSTSEKSEIKKEQPIQPDNDNDQLIQLSDPHDDVVDDDQDQLQAQRKQDPKTHVIYSESSVSEVGYGRVSVGNAFITRNVRKMTLEEGYDLYELMTPSGYKNCTSLDALYAPISIIQTVQNLSQESAEKRQRARERSEAKERKQAWQSFDKLFPRMPENEREAVFARAFEKRSGRIGHKKGFSMDSKVDLATRAHVKYRYTNFESIVEESKRDLYDQTIGALDAYDDRDARNEAYEEFRQGKLGLYDEADQEVQQDIEEKISQWK